MVKNLLRYIFVIFGGSLGGTVYLFLSDWIIKNTSGEMAIQALICAIIVLLGGSLFYFIGPVVIWWGKKIGERMDHEMSAFTTADIISSSVGLIIGLVIAYFVVDILGKTISILEDVFTIPTYLFFGYLGLILSNKRREDFVPRPEGMSLTEKNILEKSTVVLAKTKILDTSAIIDGRIADVARAGFLEGQIVAPHFVLEELQHIADSADDLKRIKGRRGLDIIKMMQEELKLDIVVSDKDFDGTQEVDMKLIKLAQFMDGKIITNDFNLNKVAQIHGVSVLNVNELSNAVKPVLIPGEAMEVIIVKEGKENNQGIAYLDDGTMIVVEDAKKKINERTAIIVTSAIQTAAGRMIFAKLND